MIKSEKEKYRELSSQIRVEGKQDKRVFEKFVNAHDEKLVLKKQAMHVENSPPAGARLKIATVGHTNAVSSSILTPQLNSSLSPLKSQRQKIHQALGKKLG